MPPAPDSVIAPLSESSPQATALKKSIDDLVRTKLLPYTNAGIKVVSLTRGDTLYDYNARLLQPPASNQKIFTAAAALALLGSNLPVTTAVALDPEKAAVYLKGCGDSMLGADDLASLATSAAGTVDRAGEYRVFADLSCFDDLYWGKGWMWDDEPDPDEMYISALAVNGNAVTVRVTPAQREGDAPRVSLFPQTSQARVVNAAVTGAAGSPANLTVTRAPGDRENLISVAGVLPLGSAAVKRRLTLWKPELAALELFAEQLRQRGISVSCAGSAATPATARVVAQKDRPLAEMVRLMMKQSDNLSAESVLKLMGLQQSGHPGSAAEGGRAVLKFLESRHIPTERVVIADGSGVSRYNLTNAETIVRVLEQVYRDPSVYPVFYDSLPIAGKDGTLARRMKRTAAEGNLRAKTGTMSGISALSGYARTAEGEPVAFSIIVQNFPESSTRAREVEDRIGELLCGFRRK